MNQSRGALIFGRRKEITALNFKIRWGALRLSPMIGSSGPARQLLHRNSFVRLLKALLDFDISYIAYKDKRLFNL
jgi:hypothetical protein